MTQNIYDNPEFFAGYSQLGRSVDGLDGAAEWPALRAMLPAMEGINVVDLGCGFGWFCRGGGPAGGGAGSRPRCLGKDARAGAIGDAGPGDYIRHYRPGTVRPAVVVVR